MWNLFVITQIVGEKTNPNWKILPPFDGWDNIGKLFIVSVSAGIKKEKAVLFQVSAIFYLAHLKTLICNFYDQSKRWLKKLAYRLSGLQQT